MNTDVLLAVANTIEAKPGKFYMASWLKRGADYFAVKSNETASILTNECNTAGCIAGWVTAIYSPDTPMHAIRDQASKIVGLDEVERTVLFSPDYNGRCQFEEYAKKSTCWTRSNIKDPFTAKPKTVAKMLRRIANGELKIIG